MARKYSDRSDAFLKRSVKDHTSDGKVDWDKVVQEVKEESGKEHTLEAIKMRYRRLISQESVRPSSRAGDKTLKRMVKWLENILESNQRMRTLLNSKKGKRRNSGHMELLKNKNKELREEIRVLKKELKSHGPILNWYVQAQRGFKIAKAKKALIE